MNSGFDVISDINVTDASQFNWQNKATSLYCIICGGISSDAAVVEHVLGHLSKIYLGVFYIGGSIEFDNLYKIRYKHAELAKICRNLPNVAYLYNHVVIVDGIALIGAVGWNSARNPDIMHEILTDKFRQQDYQYLRDTVERLQIHLDVRKIIIITHCVPDERLYFGQIPKDIDIHRSMTAVLEQDSERKISHWVYGQKSDNAGVELDGVTFLNNAHSNQPHYNARRIEC
jgi:hypothetical protein